MKSQVDVKENVTLSCWPLNPLREHRYDDNDNVDNDNNDETSGMLEPVATPTAGYGDTSESARLVRLDRLHMSLGAILS